MTKASNSRYNSTDQHIFVLLLLHLNCFPNEHYKLVATEEKKGKNTNHSDTHGKLKRKRPTPVSDLHFFSLRERINRLPYVYDKKKRKKTNAHDNFHGKLLE